jgi:diguanylate cyclase
VLGSLNWPYNQQNHCIVIRLYLCRGPICGNLQRRRSKFAKRQISHAESTKFNAVVAYSLVLSFAALCQLANVRRTHLMIGNDGMGLYLLLTSSLYLTLGVFLGFKITRATSKPGVEPVAVPEDTIVEPQPALESLPESEPDHVEHIDESIPAMPVILGNTEKPTITSELPAEWLDELADVQECRSFVEATSQVLRLEVGKYRDQLIELENRVRQLKFELENSTGTESDMPVAHAKQILSAVQHELLDMNADWIERQQEANNILGGKSDQIDTLQYLADNLQHVVSSQIAQVETAASNIKQFTVEIEPYDWATLLQRESGVLLKLTHELRDLICETMTKVLLSEDRLASCSEESLLDELTQLQNRAGLELAQNEWWKQDQDRTRTSSCILFDIDGFQKLNLQFGTRVCDQLLVSIASLIDSTVRKKRGYDKTYRIAGDKFMILMVDTSPRGALALAERVRRIVSRTQFEHHLGSINVTVSGSVTDVRTNDTTNELLKRLEETMDFAKKQGRNCSAVDEGTGPKIEEEMLDQQQSQLAVTE